MFRSRPTLRRLGLLGVALALLSGLFVIPAIAANSSVTGSLTYRGDGRPHAGGGRDRHDRRHDRRGGCRGRHRPAADRRSGQRPDRLLGAGRRDAIDPTHAYALYATISTGANTWQNTSGEPVITGGPTKGIDLVLTARPGRTRAATIDGHDRPAGGDDAGAIGRHHRGPDQGRDRDARRAPGARRITGRRRTCPSRSATTRRLIDPAATYVVKGGIVDGADVWQNREGVTAISGGTATPTVDAAGDRGARPVCRSRRAPPARPRRASVAPSTAPSVAPRPRRRRRPRPARRQPRPPRRAPTATPAPTPTPAPTATPDPHADPDAEPVAHADPDADADPQPNAHPDADAIADTHADAGCRRASRPRRRSRARSRGP